MSATSMQLTYLTNEEQILGLSGRAVKMVSEYSMMKM
jgi:hypothetical protein